MRWRGAALAAVVAAWAAPVAAGCPAVIAETDWSDGQTLRIAAREGDVAVQELRGARVAGCWCRGCMPG